MTNPVTPELADRLNAYLDGALSGADCAEIEALVAADRGVAAELAALREVDLATRRAFEAMLDIPAPLSLLRRIDEAMGAPAAPEAANLPSPPRWRLGTVAACLALLMVGGGVGVGLTRALSGDAAQVATLGWLPQVADYYAVYARQKRHLVEVPATEAAHLVTWLADSTGVTFAIPDLSDFGMTFQGARLLVAVGKPVGQLLYTDPEGRVVALCFVSGGAASGEDGQAEFVSRTLSDVGMVSWVTGAASYVVVGPAVGTDLGRIAVAASKAL